MELNMILIVLMSLHTLDIPEFYNRLDEYHAL